MAEHLDEPSASAQKTTADVQASAAYFLGAWRQDELSGLLSVGPDDEPGQLSIATLAVHPDHQRQGVGQSLLQEVLRRGNGAAFSVVSAADNLPALALYRRLGFVAYRSGSLGPHCRAVLKLRWTSAAQAHGGDG